MINKLLEEHDNIIYLCSHEEWLAFLKTKKNDSSISESDEYVAFGKWRNLEGTKQVSHTWYPKCYYTKFNHRRASALLIGRGFEFECETINYLEYALHPKTGVIVYD